MCLLQQPEKAEGGTRNVRTGLRPGWECNGRSRLDVWSYRFFLVNLYSTPTEMAKFTSFEVARLP